MMIKTLKCIFYSLSVEVNKATSRHTPTSEYIINTCSHDPSDGLVTLAVGGEIFVYVSLKIAVVFLPGVSKFPVL